MVYRVTSSPAGHYYDGLAGRHETDLGRGRRSCVSYGFMKAVHDQVTPDNAAGRRVFSGISRFLHPYIPVLFRTPLVSPLPDLKTSMICSTITQSESTSKQQVRHRNNLFSKRWSFTRLHCVMQYRCTRSNTSGNGDVCRRPALALAAETPECKSRVNGIFPRKPADQRHRLARFPLRKIRDWPGQGLNPVRLSGRRAVQLLSHRGRYQPRNIS
ncbi:hypothetical protein PR048_029549 [Dryococelus australis]|uniref:Uncharacterized protein n=1 Tax=Dryococelus australis TaxID=614101 RepID=A0ABQ9GGC5_9NEOP|nr:hypothetical protein PR048_029549 [Dryococelus australis]